jgi:uncharacterized membrane protein YphA (DoxX/SURF4 family)
MLCKSENCSCARDLGLLLLRLMIGIVFIYHGWSKVSNIAGTQQYFSTIGLGNIALVYLAAYGEFWKIYKKNVPFDWIIFCNCLAYCL